ncbi:hypothetical protein [Thalassospira tepidiphila]|uniref:hypothetical protein n=1 Tax=Thalassospira tepidiphila TaxID=393657 RepID=UPI0030C67E08
MKKENVRKIYSNFKNYAGHNICGIPIPDRDYFSEIGATVEYDRSGKVSFVELDSRCKVYLKGFSLFDHSFESILQWLGAVDDAIVRQEDGLTSLEFGISIYAPDHSECATAPPKLVSAFEKNYYGDLFKEAT